MHPHTPKGVDWRARTDVSTSHTQQITSAWHFRTRPTLFQACHVISMVEIDTWLTSLGSWGLHLSCDVRLVLICCPRGEWSSTGNPEEDLRSGDSLRLRCCDDPIWRALSKRERSFVVFYGPQQSAAVLASTVGSGRYNSTSSTIVRIYYSKC